MEKKCKNCEHRKTDPVLAPYTANAYFEYCELIECKFEPVVNPVKLIFDAIAEGSDN